MRLAAICVLVLGSSSLAACGPGPRDDGDDAPSGPCSGSETRCINNAFQECRDDMFVTVEVCTEACSQALAGCAACDPALNTACDGTDVVSCNPDGTLGGLVETCPTGFPCERGTCERDCAASGVDLIYVVDDAYRLLSFDPRLVGSGQDPFRLIGSLPCVTTMPPVPNRPGGVTPYSMSVDRNGYAWVLYTSGEVFRVATGDASCTPTAYLPMQANMLLFGMGFSLDTPSGNTEHLYIGGGDALGQTVGRLGSVDPTTAGLQIVGNIGVTSELGPELTGTGNAELFGFFPGAARAFVQQLDRTTAAPIGPELAIPGGLGGSATGYAFAQWGGKFYIFVSVGANTVRTIDRATGAYEVVLPSTPYKIVGAGVSTCAPFVIE